MISGDNAVPRGFDGAFYNTLNGFHKFFERIDIICPYLRRPVRTKIFNNVFFHPLPPGRLLRPLFIFKKGWPIINQFKPELIIAHAYGFQLMSLGGWLLAKKSRRPLVLEVMHVGGYPWAESIRDWLERQITFIFLKLFAARAKIIRVINQSEAELLSSWGIPGEKIRIIPAIYLDQIIFKPRPEIKKKYDLIFVGRLVTNKGLPLLLETFDSIKKTFPQLRLLVLGEGPLRFWLKKEIKKRQGITYLFSVPKMKDVARLYNESRVVICTSSAEGGPRFVVEAMACGLPAVSTPVGLMKEIIKDGENGFLLKKWSAEEISEKIRELLRTKNLYEKCSKGALAAASQFEYNKAISNYALTYVNLCGS